MHKLRENALLRGAFFKTNNSYTVISSCNNSAILIAISSFISYLVVYEIRIAIGGRCYGSAFRKSSSWRLKMAKGISTETCENP